MLTRDEILLLIYFITITIILVLFVVIFFIAFQNRKNKILLERFLAKQNYEKELARSQIEIQEHTLKNIAWELHDNIGQLLSVANLQLNILSRDLPEKHQEKVKETRELIQSTVQEVRSLSKVMNKDVVLKNGLIASLEVEINRLNRLEYLEASMEIVGDPVPINNASAIIIFRILQECFSNILKHAKGSKLFVILDYKSEYLNITVTDNGIGFDLNEKSLGSGMETMKKRAELINAVLEIVSQQGKGTQLILKYFYNNV